jgi:hypothetical protein
LEKQQVRLKVRLSRCRNRQLFPRDAYFEDCAGVPYTNSAYQHDFYEFGYIGEASPVSFFMVRNKLTSAVFAEIILGVVAFFTFLTIVLLLHRGHLSSMAICIIP